LAIQFIDVFSEELRMNKLHCFANPKLKCCIFLFRFERPERLSCFKLSITCSVDQNILYYLL
jgi:hypothetical protein